MELTNNHWDIFGFWSVLSGLRCMDHTSALAERQNPDHTNHAGQASYTPYISFGYLVSPLYFVLNLLQ